ncbi:uncharacterized protein L969DRAFT_91124 [Mixia osmundae IAM 14324]|uniref:Cytochrome b5 heme-binding domain-containing protein n=1 Tax=Mixia osmundae (strain CBS 9802 / IAM 14324 / JCM 22182 / KY 12970) TaxID=764103 RepID=G7E4E5_MIXOS|nr:uncharacterized protein L969DRAFT_91124 [Mixia osmundae IAM 14324]KEI36279.1 hypothetical protein L969DRAFT_91124 [Mixia osmundae IAM 14324]GAA97705.1 hypothetical protein E5Q_04383 [Mixia osmundae IAM 14324]
MSANGPIPSPRLGSGLSHWWSGKSEPDGTFKVPLKPASTVPSRLTQPVQPTSNTANASLDNIQLELPSDDEDESRDRDDGDDDKPMFPMPNSVQRSRAPPTRLAAPSSRITSASPTTLGTTTMGLASKNASLALPPSTTVPPKRVKVALAPGYSPLDWAKLKASGEDLRDGVESIMRIGPSELKRHNTKNDAWAAFQGKIYNMTPYLPFHPGGAKFLMSVAGKDGTSLFMETHAWVNVETMMDACLVGILVSDPYPDSDSD